MRELCDTSRHVRLIDATVHDRRPARSVQQFVRRSWIRCLWDYALDPSQPKPPPIVEQHELLARRERLEGLYPIAHAQMLALYHQLARADVGVVLTDCDGVIVTYVGHPGFTDMARKCGLHEGAVWSECEQGTNGMGTCLAERQPAVIDRDDHFFTQNIALTCAAAPILDGRGDVAAVLDISGRASAGQASVLALVNWAAQSIANRALLAQGRHQFRLRFHSEPEAVCTPDEGVIVVDDRGVIAGVNGQALQLLGHTQHTEVCGRPLEQLFDTTLQRLARAVAGSGMACMPLRSVDRREFSLAIQQPQSHAKLSRGGKTCADGVAVKLCDRHGSGAGSGCNGSQVGGLDQVEFGDAIMARNVRILRRVLDYDLPILLLGETGTGKGYLARAIHQAGPRADRPFITVNCAAIPESLIESELFGYQPGAFTGAARGGRTGRIVQADGGTLFLDEIGDMPLPLQVRLLSVIEDKEVTPLGGSDAIPVNVRVISATHRDLAERVNAGRFRDDLYYRINGIAVTLPPLRQRADARLLIRRLLETESDGQLRVDDSAIEHLASLPWPGNLRQLRNVLRAMIALSDGDYITVDDIPPDVLTVTAHAPTVVDAGHEPDDDHDILEQAERDALREVLASCGWKMTKAAVRLGVSRKTLYRKLQKHGIKRPQG